jgi:RNA polymerase sigma-70 factor (ECF subfamily)
MMRLPLAPPPPSDIGTAGGVYYLPSVRDPEPFPLSHIALAQLDGLYRLARHLTGSDEEAEDLVQDTYARALGKSSRFVPGTNVRAWLFRILRNLYIDHYRRARNNPVHGGIEADDASEDVGGGRELLRDDRELERLRGIVAEEIDAALGGLSVDARTVVLLDLEGFTEMELAEVLGCSVGTIKSRLSRARAVLRKRLRDYAR